MLLGIMPGQVHAAPIENLALVVNSATTFNSNDLSATEFHYVIVEASKGFGLTYDETLKLYVDGKLNIQKTGLRQVRVTRKTGINEDFLDIML